MEVIILTLSYYIFWPLLSLLGSYVAGVGWPDQCIQVTCCGSVNNKVSAACTQNLFVRPLTTESGNKSYARGGEIDQKFFLAACPVIYWGILASVHNSAFTAVICVCPVPAGSQKVLSRRLIPEGLRGEVIATKPVFHGVAFPKRAGGNKANINTLRSARGSGTPPGCPSTQAIIACLDARRLWDATIRLPRR